MTDRSAPVRTKAVCDQEDIAAEQERLRRNRAYAKKHREANREKLNARNRAWGKANREYMRIVKKQWRKDNPEKVDEHRRKATGLPEPTRPRPDVCEICEQPSGGGRALCLDHDHDTGLFRGWLCHKCNSGIGMLGDNIAGLKKAVDYLKKET